MYCHFLQAPCGLEPTLRCAPQMFRIASSQLSVCREARRQGALCEGLTSAQTGLGARKWDLALPAGSRQEMVRRALRGEAGRRGRVAR